ncbi:MAG: terminase small subunit [Janthinobacterium lividum]
MSDGLTVKRAMFVQEYLVDLNATQAAIRAGYAADSASVEGCRLLADAKVAAALAEAMEVRAVRIGISQDRIAAELSKLGFSNMLDYLTIPEDGDVSVDLTKLTRDQAAALAEVTTEEVTTGGGDNRQTTKRVKIKLSDKRAALVELGRHVGMFRDKVEHSGVINMTISSDDADL